MTKLRQFCDGDMASFVYPSSFVQGVLFAVAAAPEIPMPPQWMPWVFKQHGQLPNNTQADAFADTLMDALRDILAQMKEEEISLPAGLVYSGKSSDTSAQWCAGLIFAHSQLEALWQGAWQCMSDAEPENLRQYEKDLKHCLRMFSTFADPELAMKQALERGNEELAEQLPLIYKGLQSSLSIYVALSGELAGYLPNQFESFVQPNAAKRAD